MNMHLGLFTISVSGFGRIRSSAESHIQPRQILLETNTKVAIASDTVAKQPNTKIVTQVHQIANSLSEKLSNPSRLEYYCKVAWRLPEYMIWNNLEAALRGTTFSDSLPGCVSKSWRVGASG
jgi:hypothetical protein